MSKKKYLFYTALILVAVLILILGNIISMGDRIFQASKALGIAFYVLVAFLFVILLVWPLLKIALTPSMEGSPKQMIDKMSYSEYSKYIKRLHLNWEETMTVNSAQDGAQALTEILEKRSKCLEDEVKQTATQVFLVTSISQSGIMDFISSLYFNFRLIKRIVEKSGRRPSNVQLVRLYFSIVTTSIIITGVDQLLDDVELGEITGVVGMKLLGSVFQSILNGTANALSCLRVGYSTLAYLEVGESEFKSNNSIYRKQSFSKAKKTVLDILKSSPILMKQYVQTACNNGGTVEQTI